MDLSVFLPAVNHLDIATLNFLNVKQVLEKVSAENISNKLYDNAAVMKGEDKELKILFKNLNK